MTESEDLRGYILLDARDHKVGTIRTFWVDEGGRPLFALVERHGLLKDNEHVVPLKHSRLLEEGHAMRVPYDSATIRKAPAHDPLTPLDAEFEQRLFAHYHAAPGGRFPEHGPAEAEIELHGERVHVDKRVVEGGGVRLRKVVRTKIVNQPVEVRYEEIVLERVPPDEHPPHGGPQGSLDSRPFEEAVMYIPEFEETPIVSKTTEIVGGVRAHKVMEEEHRDVTTTVRREDVEVERRANLDDLPR